MSLNFGHLGPKTRLLNQILEKSCARCRGYIFSPIIIKLGQKLDEISDKFENRSCGVKNWVTTSNLR